MSESKEEAPMIREPKLEYFGPSTPTGIKRNGRARHKLSLARLRGFPPSTLSMLHRQRKIPKSNMQSTCLGRKKKHQ